MDVPLIPLIPLIEIEKGVVMKLSHDPLGKLSLTQVPPFLTSGFWNMTMATFNTKYFLEEYQNCSAYSFT